MKTTIKTITAIVMMAFAAPAFAGGVNVYDDGDSKLKFGGKVFIDGTSKTTDTTQAGITTRKRTQGFNLGRAYLTAKYYFNDNWLMRVTSDINQESTLKKKTNVFLKYAYLEGKLYGKAAVLRLGISHNPWIDYEQHLWKHRYFTKVTSDEFKYDNSADIGVGLKGKLIDGMVKYWVTGVNGGGYGNLSQSDAVDFKSRIGVYPIKGLTIDFGYNTGYRGKKVFGANVLRQTMYQIMASYGTHDYRIGGNFIRNKDKASKLIEAKTYAAWGWAKVGGGFGVTGRWERETSNPLNAAGVISNPLQQERTRYVLGLDYSPVKHLTFTAGWIQDKSKSYKNVIGDVKKVTQIGMWSQLKY